MKDDERTHHGAMENLNLNIRSVLACRYTEKQVDIIISKNQALQI